MAHVPRSTRDSTAANRDSSANERGLAWVRGISSSRLTIKMVSAPASPVLVICVHGFIGLILFRFWVEAI